VAEYVHPRRRAGIVLAVLMWLTVKEPPRGLSDGVSRAAVSARPCLACSRCCARCGRSGRFRHLTLAAALHSVVWYASSGFNNAFLQRSHQMTAGEAGYWIAVLSAHRRLRHVPRRPGGRSNERPMQRPAVVPVGAGIATLLCVPFQFLAYLSADRAVFCPRSSA
jgi:hypothetical protein